MFSFPKWFQLFWKKLVSVILVWFEQKADLLAGAKWNQTQVGMERIRHQPQMGSGLSLLCSLLLCGLTALCSEKNITMQQTCSALSHSLSATKNLLLELLHVSYLPPTTSCFSFSKKQLVLELWEIRLSFIIYLFIYSINVVFLLVLIQQPVWAYSFLETLF